MNSPTASTKAFETEHDVVRVAGPDAAAYLQGQLSQDVDALAVGTSTHTFVLQPQGKVDAWARMTKVAADEFLLDTDAGGGETLATRLRRFLLRTKADITTETWPVVQVRGADAPRGEVPEAVLRCAVVGPGVDGYDLVGPGATVPEGIGVGDEAGAEAYRIAHGVPAMGRELAADTIPAELGQWIVDASVSFTKGCYTGQELTARIDSRGGNVPRHLRVLRADRLLAVGATVADGANTAVTSVADSAEHGPIALAWCGRNVVPGDEVDVGGILATVHDAPIV